jgi:predicted RNA-binding protein with PIN domain
MARVRPIVLVDGYNAIRRVSSLSSAERGAGLAAGRRALVTTIVASGVLRSARVMVVFDGSDEGGVPSEPSPHPMLSVRYSTPPDDADRAIVTLVSGARPGAGGARLPVTVVTGDRELSWQTRRLGAAVVAPDEWEGLRQKRVPRSRESTRRERSDKPPPSAGDVEYWLSVFGGADDAEGGDERE